MVSRADECVKCGEPRGAIRDEKLICWDGYDELGKHRFKPWPMEGKTIVLAERVEDVVIVTPRTQNRARGVLGRELLVAKGIAGQLGYRDLFDAVAPCFATVPEPNDSEEGTR